MKKSNPIDALKALEPYVKRTGKNFTYNKKDGTLVHLIDTDTESDFYFSIIQYQNKGNFQALIEYKPKSSQSVEQHKTWANEKQIEQHFSQWVEILEEYDKVITPFDDPILASFKEEYFTDFELVEEEKENPLKINQILLLDKQLEKYAENLDTHKTETNTPAIEKIHEEIEEVRNNLTTKTKLWIFNKLAWIHAKSTHLGVSITNEVVIEGKKEMIKHLVIEAVKLASNNI